MDPRCEKIPGYTDRKLAEQDLANWEFEGWSGKIIQEGATFTLIVCPAGVDLPADAAAPAVAPAPVPVDDTAGLSGLLDFIARFESSGNYNAFFRNAGNQNNPKFTQMLLSKVLEWQHNHTAVNGNPSSAAGRYQIVRRTLQDLIASMGLNPDTERFTQATQDSMAEALLERRGLSRYRAGAMSETDFANSVAREWASMPVVSAITGNKGFTLQPGQSFYAGDGINKAHARVDDYLTAIRGVR